MDIKLQNTLSNKKETFKPLKEGEVSMYHCGPTVYDFPSIGNMRSYVFADILRRTFEYFGNEVRQVINITDVGHLVGDSDEGEDKVEKTAKSKGKTAEEISRFFENTFYDDLRHLNIKTDGTKFPRATENIEEQIEIIKLLEYKGLIYKTSDGIYFDTSKYPEYGKLGGINNLNNLESRIEENTEKHSPLDFALWKFSPALEKRLQEWPSPWGVGFPGWHIECSAMSRKYLGQPFDIHTGGIDHITVHHNNEIAQSEAAYDTPLANIWMHNEFLKVDNDKMSKSLGNIYTVNDLIAKKIHPLSFRYWLLTGRYNTPMNFTWEAVEGAQVALENILEKYLIRLPLKSTIKRTSSSINFEEEEIVEFNEAICDDLNTSIALSLIQQVTSRFVLDKMDEILGLNIKELAQKISDIPNEIKDIQKERDEARKSEDWKLSDELRDKIESKGYKIFDTPEKTTILRSLSSLAEDLN